MFTSNLAGNETVDHLQMQKLEQIVELLVKNGYYRAEVPALSMFDRVRAFHFDFLRSLTRKIHHISSTSSVLEVSAGQSLQVVSLLKSTFSLKRIWTSGVKCMWSKCM